MLFLQDTELISVSVVSHGQGALVGQALSDLARLPEPERFEVILTKNIEERLPFSVADFPFRVRVVENPEPKGFGANHNAALRLASGDWFCVMNPDIRMESDPFPGLLACLSDLRAGLAGPLVNSPLGNVEDSVRHFPTPFGLVAKLLGLGDGRHRLDESAPTQGVDWVAGMFMLFRAEDYRRLGGFDEGFFLYYEDVDICVRLWRAGRRVVVCRDAQVIHDARRASRRNPRYLYWHVSSMVRYFGKHWLRLPRTDADG